MNEKLLIVDDEQLILIAVERALLREGYLVSKAQNIKELETALKNAPFDMLITDLNMEEDSVDNVIRRVRQTSPSVKVLKMSGAVLKDKPDDFIEKPFRIDDLRKKVRDILNEPS